MKATGHALCFFVPLFLGCGSDARSNAGDDGGTASGGSGSITDSGTGGGSGGASGSGNSGSAGASGGSGGVGGSSGSGGASGAAGAPASGIIPDGRRIDWSNVGVPGGIPDRTTICTTIDASVYGNGTTDATAAINTAIQNCPPDQVVYLPSGSYLLASPIDFEGKSRVTLRGAGPSSTILLPQSTTAITSGQAGLSAERPILSGSTKGSTSIVVEDASGVQPGTMLDVFQANDPDLYWSRGGTTDRTGQFVMITDVQGTTLTFEDPLVWDFALNPRFKYHLTPVMSFSGVENLSITADATYAGSMIQFWNTYASWIRHVETAWGNGNEHIFLYGCLRNEVRDSYIHDTYSTTDGYGILTVKSSSDRGGCTGLLVENNIFSGFFQSIILETEVGSVVAYNYSRNARYTGWPDYQVPDFNANHGEHGMMLLFEGNVAVGFQNDGYHGSTSHITLFRNWLSGQHVDAQRTGNIKTVDLTRYSRYHNVVGNVLGYDGWPQSIGEYEMTGQPGYTEQPVIYRLGYPNMGNNGYSTTNPPSDADQGGLDPRVAETLLRHGNYDYETQSIVWDPTIADQALPVSLYRSARPTWWGASAWPPIGPDLTPMVSPLPAQACYDALQSGEFNPEQCYGNGPPLP